MLDPVQSNPLGEFFGRHLCQHRADGHAEIASQPEIEPALRVPVAEP
jgi:hypothetical protein